MKKKMQSYCVLGEARIKPYDDLPSINSFWQPSLPSFQISEAWRHYVLISLTPPTVLLELSLKEAVCMCVCVFQTFFLPTLRISSTFYLKTQHTNT